MKRLLLALLFVVLPSLAHAASCSSYPFTLQNNTTADATQVMSNFNTVRNCVINNAAGSGVNTDITSLTGLSTPLSVPQGGTPVFIGGTSTGTANAQVVASTNPIGYSLTSGYRVTFTAGATNTTAATLNVNATGATAVRKLGHAGLEALTGGEMAAGNIVEAIYDGTFFVLLTTPFSDIGPLTTIASATTTDLGTVSSHNAQITGTTTITAFGSTASVTEPIYYISFTGALTLTYNATSLIIPGAGNITTANGDTATVEYLGSGNWRVLQYTRASGAGIVAITPLPGALNLSITNNSGTPDTNITLTADYAVMLNSSLVPITASSVSLTINCTTTGANGLDAGSLTTGTWYYIYVISNGTTTAGLASTSSTAPTMPSGYTYKVRLGAMLTDGSSHFKRTLQRGGRGQYTLVSGSNTTALPQIAAVSQGSVTVPTYVAKTVAAFIPSTATEIIIDAFGGGSGEVAIAAPNANYGAYNSATVPPPAAVVGAGTAPASSTLTSLTLESSSIYVATTANSQVFVFGWKDNVNAN